MWLLEVEHNLVKNQKPEQPEVLIKQRVHPVVSIAIASFLCVSIWLIAQAVSRSPSPGNPIPNGSVIILPVKHTFKSLDHHWVYLGAMDQLISMVSNRTHWVVRDTETVLELMQQAELKKGFDTEEVPALFGVTGAKLIVETLFTGSANEYRLIYTLHYKSHIEQGVIDSNTVGSALIELSSILADSDFAQENDRSGRLTERSYRPNTQFNNALMARALMAMEAHDYVTSERLLSALVLDEPENILAQRKYGEALLKQQKFEQAKDVFEQAIDKTPDNNTELPRLFYWLAHVMFQQKKYEQAIDLFSIAADKAALVDDWLYQAYAFEMQGLILTKMGKASLALAHLTKAIEHYGDVYCPIGRSRTQLLISDIYHTQGERAASLASFSKAEALFNTYQLSSVKPFYESISLKLQHK